MAKCLNCGTDLLGKYQRKFCSHSCSATYNQTGRSSNNKNTRVNKICFQKAHIAQCSICGKTIKRESTCCAPCAKRQRRCNSYISHGPYAGCLTSLPYIASIHGRRIVRYTDALGKKRSTSLARYLMSLYLGYIPTNAWDVDHIDQDPTNDRISNLQLISKQANLSKGGKHNSRHVIHATCAVCGAVVQKPGLIAYYPRDTIFTCSRMCAGHISHMRKTMSLSELHLRNAAFDVDVPRQSVPIIEYKRIERLSPDLEFVLNILLAYGQDYYPSKCSA